MRKADVVLGLQWGDEGKGKVVDVLTPKYKVIARFQGGPNAGHSLHFGEQSYVLHTIPSGIFREDSINIIGNGVVIDPVILAQEIERVEKAGIDVASKLYISKKAHLILPSHRILDAASEAAKGETKIGSTLKGIGPTYMDKTGRNGLRVGDLISPHFREKYNKLKEKHLNLLQIYDFEFDLKEYEEEWVEGIEKLLNFKFIDSEYEIHNYLKQDVPVLAEGAQGTLLDIDFGTYPFVTSSNTVSAAACTGLGLAPTQLGTIYGIFKAYCTRVGSGPFPTELHDKDGEKLREVGKEFGSTTGRPRRCGWLDLTALKYSIMINGVNALIMTKADVLNDFETIKLGVGYRVDGEKITTFPFDDSQLEPVYKEFKGWNCDINDIRRYEDFPQELKDFVSYIEKECEVPIKIVSIGPDREETIMR